jgi:hypothetical protein
MEEAEVLTFCKCLPYLSARRSFDIKPYDRVIQSKWILDSNFDTVHVGKVINCQLEISVLERETAPQTVEEYVEVSYNNYHLIVGGKMKFHLDSKVFYLALTCRVIQIDFRFQYVHWFLAL